ncbi:hypothetical protein [Antrihabitans sp. YC2-6]|uniref:hypothetical protein n=1 Tax=Antrihabitans sp. YC2-6 TaxID=2799498 RepID=UPI0018F73FAD|nr:hypothetical protein [Antrihabitans sp. YC2-6]MBJ8344754.1 hypothetical protein [Antrihabitans sp. YC2-6]
MDIIGSGPFIDWEAMTGLSKFWIDMISVPLFSAVAGVLVNWTGVYMLFTPVNFRGFYVPGLKTLFPFIPRKVQQLPIWAPGGIIGYQGFIPARAEKMACYIVDKAVARIGSVKDFYYEFDPQSVAVHMSEVVKRDLRPLVSSVMEREHPGLWRDMTPAMREIVYDRIEAEMPGISERALERIGENVEQMIDIRLMAMKFLKNNPEMLKDIVWNISAPELKFMIRIGLLGLPFGMLFALVIYYYGKVPYLDAIPGWVVVLTGAALIGVTVNLLAIKVVFEPAEPQPRYKYLWKQAKLAKRQPQAAEDFGKLLATNVINIPNVADELLNGPRGDRVRGFMEDIVTQELDRVLGPLQSVVRAAVGTKEFDAIKAGSMATGLEYAPTIINDEEFNAAQAAKIERFARDKLRELSPAQFMELIYSVIEQDAWLLYVHGALLGLGVGGLHLLLFGS